MRASILLALLLCTLSLAGCAQEEVSLNTDSIPIGPDGPAFEEAEDAGAEGTGSEEGPAEEEPQAAPQGGAAEEEAAEDEAPSEEEQEALEEGVAFEPVRDIILEQVFTAAGAPEPTGMVFPSAFVLEKSYQTLELVAAVECTGEDNVRFLDYLDVKVTAPDGSETVAFMSLGQGVIGLAVGEMSSCTNTFPIHYEWDPMEGEYGLEVTALTPTSVTLWVIGSSGLAPDFEYRLLDTEEIHHLSDHVGRVVVIDLMATWCGPCNDAMPDLVSLKESYGGLIEILSVDIDTTETDDELRDFKEGHGAGWTFGFDHNDTLDDTYNTGWIPSFAVVDQNGGLAYRQIGAFDPAKASDIIDYLLAHR